MTSTESDGTSSCSKSDSEEISFEDTNTDVEIDITDDVTYLSQAEGGFDMDEVPAKGRKRGRPMLSSDEPPSKMTRRGKKKIAKKKRMNKWFGAQAFHNLIVTDKGKRSLYIPGYYEGMDRKDVGIFTRFGLLLKECFKNLILRYLGVAIVGDFYICLDTEVKKISKKSNNKWWICCVAPEVKDPFVVALLWSVHDRLKLIVEPTFVMDYMRGMSVSMTRYKQARDLWNSAFGDSVVKVGISQLEYWVRQKDKKLGKAFEFPDNIRRFVAPFGTIQRDVWCSFYAECEDGVVDRQKTTQAKKAIREGGRTSCSLRPPGIVIRQPTLLTQSASLFDFDDDEYY